MKRIQKVSKIVRSLALIWLVANPVFFGAWLHEVGWASVRESWPRLITGILQMALEMFALYGLVRLMRAMEQGGVFASDNAGRVKTIGVVGVVYAFVPALDSLLAGGPIKIVDTSILFFALMVLVLAWVLDEARRLYEEQALVI